MTVRVSSGIARAGTRIRFAILFAAGLLIGHDAVYAARFGVGRGFDAAMSTLGHDGWWGPFGLTVLAAIVGLALSSTLTIRSLRSRIRRAGAGHVLPGPTALRTRARWSASGTAYLAEFRALWPRLFGAVVLAFAVQENLETFAARGDVPGVDVLLGSGFPVALVVLALVTAGLAALGALIRWRILELRRRLRLALRSCHPRPRAVRPAREWSAVHLFAPHRWILVRLDAGRAPPRGLFA